MHSLSRESRVVDGSDVTLDQEGTTLVLRAAHRCRVVEHDERAAGALAERYHPDGLQEAVRKERERDANHVGPLDVGGLRGIDSGADRRGLASEIVRNAGSPWMLVAAAGGIVERLLVAHARVDAKIDDRGESSSSEREIESTPCRDNPYDGNVALRLGDGGPTITLGRTGSEGRLRIDLGTVLEPHAALLDAAPLEGMLLFDGEVVGAVDLRHVVGSLALRALHGELRASPTPAAGSADPRVVSAAP